MTLVSGIILIGGLTVAVVAFAQLARRSVRLQADLDELRAAKDPGSTGAATARADVRPMFGELFEVKPSPLEALGDWPGVPLAIAAAGLFAFGMVTQRPPRATRSEADSTIAHDIAAARLQYDSLAKEVDALQDSLARWRTPMAAVARVTEKRAASRSLAQKTSVAPLPSLPKFEP